MSKELSPNEFYKLVAKQLGKGYDHKIIKKVWESFIELSYNELRTNGQMRLPYFGIINTTIMGGEKISIPNSEEDKKRLNTKDAFRFEYVDEYLKPTFSFAENYIDILNQRTATRQQKFAIRQKIKEQQKQIALEEKQARILKKRQEAFAVIRQKRLDDLAEKKKRENLPKKQIEKLIEQEQKDDYGY